SRHCWRVAAILMTVTAMATAPPPGAAHREATAPLAAIPRAPQLLRTPRARSAPRQAQAVTHPPPLAVAPQDLPARYQLAPQQAAPPTKRRALLPLATPAPPTTPVSPTTRLSPTTPAAWMTPASPTILPCPTGWQTTPVSLMTPVSLTTPAQRTTPILPTIPH